MARPLEDRLTASELAFLALGLGLGLAAGAVVLRAIRSRAAMPRQVLVTIGPGAIPRRPATLSTLLAPDPNAPAPLGPGDRRALDRDDPAIEASIARQRPVMIKNRTSVPIVVMAAGADTEIGERKMIGIPVEGGVDPALAALNAAALDHRPVAVAVAAAALAGDGQGQASSEHHSPADQDEGAGNDAGAGLGAGAGAPPDRIDDGPCAEPRRLAEERCAVAGRAAAEATRAADELRSARRAYDEHVQSSERAAALADPNAVREAKDAAQHAYRVARAAANRPEELEAAAAAWLSEINAINGRTRDAAAAATRGREAAAALLLTIERLTVGADAARISAEAAQEACLAAREALAYCEERAVSLAAMAARPPTPEPVAMISDEVGLADESIIPSATSTGVGTPRILRILRGERAAMTAVVEVLAGPEPSERRRWQLMISDLADAIVARAIEASMLEFPEHHPFWGMFDRAQCRDIATTLASLGYRFDGLGGFVDGRLPAMRDLSLALGYAGLDPMRVRVWPNESQTAELFRDVHVAADEYLAGAAGEMTLAEMIDMLGRRAEPHADLWNEWGRARPALLAVD
jgi:hypothetical protein